MKISSLEAILRKIFLGLVFLSLLTPLVFFKTLLRPYIAGKMIFFQILVLLLLLIWIFLLILDFRKYRPRFNLINLSLSLFIFAIFLSTLFSLNFYRSFWGNAERMEGFLNLFHFYLFTLALSSVLKEKEIWRKLLVFSLIVSFFCALYPLLQKFNLLSQPPLKISDRPPGSFGNPTFLSGYLLVHLFLGLWLILDNYQRKKKLFSLINFLLFFIILFNFAILIWLATRGSFLGLFLAIFLSLLFLIFFFPKKIRVISVIFLILLILISSLFFFYREKLKNFSLVQKINLLQRFALSLSWQDSSARARLAAWSWSLNWFTQRPLLGVGQDMFYLVYDKNYDANNFNLNSERFDRSHNKFIDLLVMNGLVGFFSYLLLFGSLFFLLIKSIKQENSTVLKLSFLSLFALLVAYLGHLFFVFDTPANYLIFFFILAWLAVFFSKESEFLPGLSEKLKIKSWQIFLFFFSFLLSIFLFYRIDYLPLRAAYLTFRAANTLIVEEAFQKFQKAIDLNTHFSNEVRKAWGDYFSRYLVYLQTSQRVENKEKLKELANWFIEEMRKGKTKEELFDLDLYPGFIYSQLSQLNFFSESERNEFDQKAELIFQEINQKLPQRTDIYIIYPEGLILRQDFSKAEKWAKLILERTPQYPRANWLWGIISLTKEGRVEEAFFYIKKAIELGHRWEIQQKAGLLFAVAPYLKEPQLLISLLEDQLFYWKNYSSPSETLLERTFRQEKIRSLLELLVYFYTQYEIPAYQKVASYLEEILLYQPNRPDYWAKLAVCYAKLKMKEAAISAARKAIELDPATYQEEGEIFINLVETEQWERIP